VTSTVQVTAIGEYLTRIHMFAILAADESLNRTSKEILFVGQLNKTKVKAKVYFMRQAGK